MTDAFHYAKVGERFGVIARKYCAIVDSAPKLKQSELLTQTYEVLPSLIDAAVHLPEVGISDDTEDELDEGSAQSRPAARMTGDEWQELHRSLKEKLGDADLYWMVFDAAKKTEAIPGSLADDIADIYRDLKEGLVRIEEAKVSPQDVIWEWRLGFESHWGHHAMSALKTIHDIRNY